MKNVEELSQSFTLNIINHIEYFEFTVQNEHDGQDYFDKLAKDAAKYDLEDVFKWDPKKLKISISKKDFIQWRKKALSKASAGQKALSATKRKFYQCGDNFFTIPLERDSVLSVLQLFQAASYRNDLGRPFVYNEKFEIIEISSKDYENFYRKVISKKAKCTKLKEREIKKDDHKKCYFIDPLPGESITELLYKLRGILKYEHVKTTILEKKEDRIEISEENYPRIKDILRKRNLPIKFAHLRTFELDNDIYFTKPRKDCEEKVEDVFESLKYHFNKSYNALNITPYLDKENNRVCLKKEDYVKWQDCRTNGKAHDLQRMLERKYNYDPSKDRWITKKDKRETIRGIKDSFSKCCKTLKLSENIFDINISEEQIEFTDENYKLFRSTYLKHNAKKSKAFGVPLVKDEKENVYYCKTTEINYSINKSYNTLADLLGIKVKFYNRNHRTELSVKDYETLIQNPIIHESLFGSEQAEVTNKVPPRDESKSRARKTKLQVEKPQKAENTKGGISVKYLEDTFRVPFEHNSETNEKESKALLSKGHIIPFSPLKNILLENSTPSELNTHIRINSHGINGDVTVYPGGQKDLKALLSSNNVVFVRAGRKEDALIPALNQQEKSVIILLMTREEYNEMEKSLSFDPSSRLPANIKLCIIDSCSVKNQPQDQPESYLRASNIKRVMAFAIAHGFDLKNFVLMDDNSTQIQIAEKVGAEASIDSLFQLFEKYKAKGTVCATLGSFEPFKNITHPLEADQVENVEERLGSKIMYVDYNRIRQKLKSESKQLHDILSPCSLWWGEDYFNMLAMLLLLENDNQAGLLGVVPYSVAWHTRSHTHQNKAKRTPHFKLGNIWLKISKDLFEKLSPHQQQVIKTLQNLVLKAIEEQEAKVQKFHETLGKNQIDEPVNEIDVDNAESIDNSSFHRGYQRGKETAKCGHPLDIEKLKRSLNNIKDLDVAKRDEYIKGFTEGHQTTWESLTPETKAFCRGYRDGFLAAKRGYTADKLNLDDIPTMYQELTPIYLQGYDKGNNVQWNTFSDLKNVGEVEDLAITMGIERANSGFEINEDKLKETIALFGSNASTFEIFYREAFTFTRASLSEDQIIIKKATQLAKDLIKSEESEIDDEKLIHSSRIYGNLAKLYKDTVIYEFNKYSVNKAADNSRKKPF